MKWLILLTLGLAPPAFAPPAFAKPVAYDLQPDASNVQFETDFGKQLITGNIPIASADLVIDFEALANCRIDVVLNAAKAGASFPFAADAMKGGSVLDTATHPQISFQSTTVKAEGKGARVKGNITIRGVTRPVTLAAEIFRQQGTEAGDRSRLTIRLTGQVKRSDFGATGWSDMVADEVRIIITARIVRRD
jgi:polyisoprenoid-binding protein YceI